MTLLQNALARLSKGRYISSDPIGLAGGLNTFNYANVNPVMGIDPEGLTSSDCFFDPGKTGCGGGGRLGGVGIMGLGLGALGSVKGCEGPANDNKATDPTLDGKVQEWPTAPEDPTGCKADQEYMNAWRQQLESTRPFVPQGTSPGPNVAPWNTDVALYNEQALLHNARCPQYKVGQVTGIPKKPGS